MPRPARDCSVSLEDDAHVCPHAPQKSKLRQPIVDGSFISSRRVGGPTVRPLRVGPLLHTRTRRPRLGMLRAPTMGQRLFLLQSRLCQVTKTSTWQVQAAGLRCTHREHSGASSRRNRTQKQFRFSLGRGGPALPNLRPSRLHDGSALEPGDAERETRVTLRSDLATNSQA